MALRPYLVPFRGTTRLVEATGKGPARNHVIKAEIARLRADVGDVRAAKGSDVAAFVRGGGKIERVGDAPQDPGDRARQLFGAEEQPAGEDAAPPQGC